MFTFTSSLARKVHLFTCTKSSFFLLSHSLTTTTTTTTTPHHTLLLPLQHHHCRRRHAAAMPPRSARIGAREAHLTYWTADAEGCRQIKKWLDQELEGDQLCFFGSFINKCAQEVQKLKNAGAKWQSAEEKPRVSDLREVLRAWPLDVRAFVGLMDAYLRRDYVTGVKGGRVANPDRAG
jgi:hypothetical protein